MLTEGTCLALILGVGTRCLPFWTFSPVTFLFAISDTADRLFWLAGGLRLPPLRSGGGERFVRAARSWPLRRSAFTGGRRAVFFAGHPAPRRLPSPVAISTSLGTTRHDVVFLLVPRDCTASLGMSRADTVILLVPRDVMWRAKVALPHLQHVLRTVLYFPSLSLLRRTSAWAVQNPSTSNLAPSYAGTLLFWTGGIASKKCE